MLAKLDELVSGVAVLALLGVVTANAQSPITIRDMGSPSRRLDITVAAEGYNVAELTVVGPDGRTDFRRDLEVFIDDLFSVEPIKEYASYINIHILETVSVDSGIGTLTNPKNTFWGVRDNDPDPGFGCPIVPDETLKKERFEDLAGADLVDLKVLLVNTDLTCSTGGDPVALSANGGWIHPEKHFAHEVFGHRLANLGDEKFLPGDDFGPCTHNLNRPNIQKWPPDPNAPMALRWDHWIDEQAVRANIIAGNPTIHPGGDPLVPVGLYEGAYFCSVAPNILYRPTHRSLMWSTDDGGEFGVVNAEAIVRGIYVHAEPIDASFPDTSAVRIGNRRSVSFEVVPMTKPTNPISTRFVGPAGLNLPVTAVDIVGPASIAGGHEVGVGGPYAVVGVVEDLTPLVRRDPGNQLWRWRVWNLDVVCTSDCNESGNVTISELITSVNRRMGRPGVCDHADANNNGDVSVSELVDGVQNMLRGCTTGIVPPTPGGTTSGTTGPPEIQIGTVGGIAGQVVSVPISVSGGNVLAGLQLDVTFEDADISLANADTPCTLDPSADDMELDTSIATVAPGQTRLRVLVIDTTAPISTFSDGVVMRCNFRIDATAPSPSSVQLIGSLNEVADESLEVLDSSVTNGSVNICPGCGCS